MMKRAFDGFGRGRALHGFLAACLLWSGGVGAAEFRVMSFNIEWGGALVSFDQTVEAIRQAKADVVGIQEAEGNLQVLADRLGWHADARNYVISRFPLLDPPGADGRFVLVEVEPGRVIAMVSLHLPSDPYGPYAVIEGADPEAVLELERVTRMPMLMPSLEVLPPLAEAGMPVIVVGDFNAPSHADWTEMTVGLRSHMRYAFDWPVSSAMETAGFIDAWRAVYPDPVTHPGLTWWAARPHLARWTPAVDEPQDRIDFAWFAGPVTAKKALLAGEVGGPEVSVALDPWPSDHRAVIVDFDAKAVPMPELLTTLRRVHAVNAPVDVRFEGAAGTRIRTWGPGADGGTGPLLDERVVEGSAAWRLPENPGVAGRYRVTAERGGQVLERVFWVTDPSAAARVGTAQPAWPEGEGIELHWGNAPGNRNDYVAIYPEGAAHREDEAGVAWAYVGAVPFGSLVLDATTAGAGWPLPAGRYVARLLEDDGYTLLAESEVFMVEAKD